MHSTTAWRTLATRYNSEPGQRARSQAYPKARIRGSVTLPSGQVLTAPQIPLSPVSSVFNWSFHLREFGAPSRATVTSRRIVGPAYIDQVAFHANLTLGIGLGVSFQLGYSRSPVDEGINQSAVAIPGLIQLYESDWRDDGGFADTGHPGIFLGSNPSGNGPIVLKLGVDIAAGDFYLVASIRATSNSASIVDGVVRVHEAIDPATFRPL